MYIYKTCSINAFFFCLDMPPCLSSFAASWEQLRASPEIIKLVKYGHEIKFDIKPCLTRPKFEYATILSPDKMDVVRNEISSLLSKNAIKIVPEHIANKKLGVYSKLFCVPKPGVNNWRPVINLKPLNKFIKKENFKMETLKDVRATLKPGDFGATVDLTDAYFHVKIHKKSRRYLRFIFE